MSYVFMSLKELFLSKTWSTKSIILFCVFLFSCYIVNFIKFLLKIKELIVFFFCFYFYCSCILKLRFNRGMFNFFMFDLFKQICYKSFFKLMWQLDKTTVFIIIFFITFLSSFSGLSLFDKVDFLL